MEPPCAELCGDRERSPTALAWPTSEAGAGLFGLCLAIARPDLELTLIEPLERRVIWLQEVVDDLGLDNVTVMRTRAELAVGHVEADVVTARAVSALTNLAGMTIPLLAGHGEVVAIKGAAPQRKSIRRRRLFASWAE